MDTSTYNTGATGNPEDPHAALYAALNEVETAANHTNQLIDLAVEKMMDVHRGNLDPSSAASMTSADALAWVARDTSQKVAEHINGMFPMLHAARVNEIVSPPIRSVEITLGCVTGPDTASLSVGMDRFTDFTMAELLTYLNAILLARHALTGAASMPRMAFGSGQKFTYNRAGDATEQLLEFLDTVQAIICKTALAATPKDKNEQRQRGLVLLKATIDIEGEIFEVADLVTMLQDAGAAEGGAK